MNTAQHFVIHGNVQVYNITPGHTAAPFHDPLGAITQQRPEINFNTNRTYKSGKKAPDGIEIRFGTARPTEATRQLLKDHGFQFSERQTMWYAVENEKSRALADRLANEDVEVDTTQYIKQHFWARVRSSREYDQLREYSEFFVKSAPPKNFNTKKALERSAIVDDLIADGILYFKKFYNRAVDEEAEENDAEPPDSSVIADRLQAIAGGMQKAIDEKFNSATSRQRPTNRRNRIVESMEAEGKVLQGTQRVLYALAAAHRSGNISRFPLLENIRTKSQVSMLNLLERSIADNWRGNWAQDTFERSHEDFNSIGIDSFRNWEIAEEQKQALLKEFSGLTTQEQETDQQRRIAAMERDIWNRDIPGFFPTPRPLIDRMIEISDLKATHRILDPSAGKGDILDVVKEKFAGEHPELLAMEINSSLREILSQKGYNMVSNDMLAYRVIEKGFDRILMNPPFENGQDADHVTHASLMLASGGRLVAIVSEGLFFRKGKKERSFRQLLRNRNAYVSEVIEGGFTDAFNRTGVRVRIIALNEDGSHFPLLSSGWERPGLDDEQDDYSSEHSDETIQADNNMPTDAEANRLMELEAEAELELLRMRVEAERRKRQRGMNGAPAHRDKLQYLRQKAWALNNKWQVSDFK